MNKKTIYMHIGTHKTGTTALQNFFVENKNILREKGILYDNYNEISLNHYNLITPKNWDKFKFDKNNNYLLSCEDFYTNIFNIKEKVHEISKIFDIVFIVYLKRQDLMIESAYNQMVKMDAYYNPIEEKALYNLDYYSFLKQLESTFKSSIIKVRVYEKEQFIGSSIFSDFLSLLNLELTSEFILSDKVINPSLSRDKLELAKYINMLGLPMETRKHFNRLLIETSVVENEVSIFRKQNLLSPSYAQSLVKKYEEKNNMIAKEFMNKEDGVLFLQKPQNDENWQEYQGLTRTIIKNLFKKVHALDPNIFETILELAENNIKYTEPFIKSANLLFPIIYDVLNKDIDFKPLEVDLSINKFINIKSKLNENFESADILRETALAFEENSNLQTAYEIMKIANILRPEGPFIKNKLEEYKRKLNNDNR